MRLAFVCSLLVACGGAASPVVPAGTQDTLEAHARAQDDEGLKRASIALKSKSKDERMRALAALLEYEPAKLASMLADMSERATKGDDAEKAAAIWALVHAEDLRVASAALAAWDAGTLARVKKLDGSNALDVAALARLVAQATVPEEQAAQRRKVIAAALPSVPE